MTHYHLSVTLCRRPPCCLIHCCNHGGKDVSVVAFLWDSYSIIPEFAVLIQKFGRMFFVYFAFDIAQKSSSMVLQG